MNHRIFLRGKPRAEPSSPCNRAGPLLLPDSSKIVRLHRRPIRPVYFVTRHSSHLLFLFLAFAQIRDVKEVRENYHTPKLTTIWILMNCIINECIISFDKGGKIYLSGSGKSLTADNCSFETCNSNKSDGGSIYCNTISTFIVRNVCAFADCSACYSGGAIWAYSISACFFVHSSGISWCIRNNYQWGGMNCNSYVHLRKRSQ